MLVVLALAGGFLWSLRSDHEPEVVAGPTELVGGAIPVRANVTRAAGAPIADGFTVAEGSVLVGYPLPLLYSEMSGAKREDDGWTTLLLVTESARGVLDRYLRQADALGFPVWGPSCRTDRGVLACAAGAREGFSYRDGYDHGRSLTFDLLQGRGTKNHPPLSSIRITYHRVGDPPYPEAERVDMTPEPDDAFMPTEWPALPEVGEEFWSDRPFTVVPGTILLAHPTAVGGVGSGTTSLFEVTGDPEEVLEAFWEQRPKTHGGLPRDERHEDTRSRNGVTIRSIEWTDGQGQSFRIWEQKDHPAILLVQTSPSD